VQDRKASPMYTPLPPSSEVFEQLSWPAIEPWYRELTATALSPAMLLPWLTRWSRLSELVDETSMWLERPLLLIHQLFSQHWVPSCKPSRSGNHECEHLALNQRSQWSRVMQEPEAFSRAQSASPNGSESLVIYVDTRNESN
jgi:hypothetical protein